MIENHPMWYISPCATKGKGSVSSIPKLRCPLLRCLSSLATPKTML
ncbi:unnamed protein product [Gulo gulo]|uniref:Uncharacterized protein n=1 Tax=Gulo gulo TaxID=48420 RepID=A0A9X9MBL3_GULGU|nr:unnamed protein product [Gulo gulo]